MDEADLPNIMKRQYQSYITNSKSILKTIFWIDEERKVEITTPCKSL